MSKENERDKRINKAILEDALEFGYEKRIMNSDDEIDLIYNQYESEDSGDYEVKNKSIFLDKASAKNMNHKEIAYRIKKLSKANFNGWIVLLIILSVFYFFYFLSLCFEIEDFGFCLLVLFFSIIGIVTLFYSCYFVYIILSGFAALIYDVNYIKESIMKKNDDNNFDDLPRF